MVVETQRIKVVVHIFAFYLTITVYLHTHYSKTFKFIENRNYLSHRSRELHFCYNGRDREHLYNCKSCRTILSVSVLLLKSILHLYPVIVCRREYFTFDPSYYIANTMDEVRREEVLYRK